MKKYLVPFVALLAIAAACQLEPVEDLRDGNRIDVVIRPVQPETRTVFNYQEGLAQQFIQWTNTDALAVFIHNPEQGYWTGLQEFTIGSDLENPEFSGSFYMNLEPAEMLYAFSPFESTRDELTVPDDMRVILPTNQYPSQTGFDTAADVMMAEAYPIGQEKSDGEGISISMKFAHLFGFGRLDFDCTQHADELVSRVEIKANQPISGIFGVDLNASYSELAVTPTWESSPSLVIYSDGTLPLKDYKCWFVAAPGEYDFSIKVYTDKGILAYDRSGFPVQRAMISRKTIHSTTNDDISTRRLLTMAKMKSSANAEPRVWSIDYNAAGQPVSFGNYTFQYDLNHIRVFEGGQQVMTIILDQNGKVIHGESVGESWSEVADVNFTDGAPTEVLVQSLYQGVSMGQYTVSLDWGQDGCLSKTSLLAGTNPRIESIYQDYLSSPVDEYGISGYMMMWRDEFNNLLDSPLLFTMAWTKTIASPMVLSRATLNDLWTEQSNEDKYADFEFKHYDGQAYLTAYKVYRNNRCYQSWTFSYELSDAPDPVFPDNVFYPGMETKLPRRLLRRYATGETDVINLEYDSEGRLAMFHMSPSAKHPALECSYAWSATSCTAQFSNGDVYTYALDDGKVVSVKGPGGKFSLGTGWSGETTLLFDDEVFNSANAGSYRDIPGGVGTAYVLSHLESDSWYLPVLLAAPNLTSHYNEGFVPTSRYVGGDDYSWFLAADSDGDLSDIVCLRNGEIESSLSISYEDSDPSYPLVLDPVVPAQKSICQIAVNHGGYDVITKRYYDASGNLTAEQSSNEIVTFIRGNNRIDCKRFSANLRRDNLIPVYVQTDENGHVTRFNNGDQLFVANYSGDHISSLVTGGITATVDWEGDNMRRLTINEMGTSQSIEFTYGEAKDNFGYVAYELFGSSTLMSLTNAFATANLPVSSTSTYIEDGNEYHEVQTLTSESDAAGDLTRLRWYKHYNGEKSLGGSLRFFYNYDPVEAEGAIINGGASGEDYHVKPL